MSFEILSGVREGFTLSTILFNYIIDWILGQALQDYAGVPVVANVHVSELAYAGNALNLSNREIQGLL